MLFTSIVRAQDKEDTIYMISHSITEQYQVLLAPNHFQCTVNTLKV